MKKSCLVLTLALLLLASCSTTTKDFVSDYTLSQEISIEEKLEYYGGRNATVDIPEIYLEGDLWLERMTELVSEAEDYILISTFLGSSCESLETFYKTLMAKAEEGVDVYFIMDGTSSYDMTESQFFMTPLYFLRDAGVHLLEYAPLSAMRLINPLSVVYRDHRKLMVIDGKIAAIGGMNINYISLGAGDRNQDDSMYVFQSTTLCKAFVSEFVKIWNASSVEKISVGDFAFYDSQDGAYDAWLFNRGTGSNASISGMYGSLFAEAKESIKLFPYLPVLNEDMEKALKLASERGVDVDIVLPIDTRGYAQGGLAYKFPDLIEATGAEFSVVDVDSRTGEVLPLQHEKLLVIDDRFVVIGSANFNYRSMELSYELALVIDSPEFARIMSSHFDDVKEFRTYTLTPELADEMKEEFSNIFAYLFMYYGG